MALKIKIILLSSIFNLFGLAVSGAEEFSSNSKMEKIEWDNSLKLPSLSGKANIGIAGAFSGFIGNTLVVGGGSNFPDSMPWRGGHKTWFNTIYYINVTKPDAKWNIIPKGLPRSLAYGCSIELSTGILCIGGCDSARCYKDVFQIQFINGKIKIDTEWPALPIPLANATAYLLGNKVYIAGGQTSMAFSRQWKKVIYKKPENYR